MKPFKAIAAMSENRVIGNGNTIPWHLPEDFKWFKQTTTGHIIVMGRKTYESIGRLLPNRSTVILTRSELNVPGAVMLKDLADLKPAEDGRETFICGGAEIYGQMLPQCSDLYLTLVKRTVEGDAFFPPFEEEFELVETLRDTPEFAIRHYRRK